MTQTSLFFDSVSGDRIYTSAAWSQIWGALFPNGVIANIAAQLGIGQDGLGTMNVSVSSGAAFVQGKFYQNDAQFLLAVSTSDPTNPRIDRVILRVDYTARTLTCLVKAGTPAVSPVPPTLTTSLGVTWEYSLAQVAVAAGATAIVLANITTESTLVASNAYLSFAKVKGGANTALATLPNDTVEIVAGTNVSVATNVSTKQVTVGVTGTVAHATLADTATLATNATNATSATTATNATQLGGVAASGYVQNTGTPDVSAYETATQTFPLATITKMNLTHTSYNVGSGWSTSTSAFTAPSAGTYVVTVKVTLTQSAASDFSDLWVYLNGANAAGVQLHRQFCDSNFNCFMMKTFLIALSASDVMDFRINAAGHLAQTSPGGTDGGTIFARIRKLN